MERDDDATVFEQDDELRALFDALPRDAQVDPRAADRVVVRLEREGFFASRSIRWRWPVRLAAAALLLAVGSWGGWVTGRHGSLEEALARKDLSVSDRVLLLQRAGTAYVTAAQGYANATAQTDSTAVEVASRVLMGAAQAVARNHLDAGLASRLTAVFETSAPRSRPAIWF